MTRRDDVPVHGSEMVQEVDSDETLAAPVDSDVEDVTASSDLAATDSHDEQPFFVISEGVDPLDPAAPQSAEESAQVVEAEAVEAPAGSFESADEPVVADAAVADPADESAAADAVADEPVAPDALTEEFASVAEEASAAGEQESGTNLPEDLRELNDLLDRPTAEIMPITDEAAAAAMAAAGGESVAAETASAEGDAAADAAAAEAAADGDGEAPGAGDATESFDEIAPGTVAAAAVAEGSEAEAPEVDKSLTTVSWWPFLAYMGVWLLAAGGSAFALQQLPSGQVAYESELYTYVTFGGVALLATGPILLLITWLVSWLRTDGAKVGSMLISALVKGSSATLFGAALWLGMLLLVDYLRLGRPY